MLTGVHERGRSAPEPLRPAHRVGALTAIGLDWSVVETFMNLQAGLEAAIRVRQRARTRMEVQRRPGIASPAR